MINTVIINFRGGIILPNNLYNILVAASKIKVQFVKFSLRQQLLVEIENYSLEEFTTQLELLNVPFEINTNKNPNIISSYPAEDVFIRNTWLSEKIYTDVLSSIEYTPHFKINICDRDQSITPILTGNINWIASIEDNYWHLIIRFPKTNVIFEWDQLTNSAHIAKVSKLIEDIIASNPSLYIDNVNADGVQLFSQFAKENLNIKVAVSNVILPPFNLPYYEGLNRYNNNNYWLGIYRRDELFNVEFLKSLCKLCIKTKLEQICCTAWKTILIKNIEEKDKAVWNLLLEKFQINMRHAANELNFQVQDNSIEALELKSYLVKNLSIDDTRTFGICIGIKTRNKSEIFSSILIRKRYHINFGRIRLFKVYDILFSKNFNPNERTEEVYSRGNPKIVLPEQLRRAVLKYYHYKEKINTSIDI